LGIGVNAAPQLFAAASKRVLKIDCDVTAESEMRSERMREVDAREIKTKVVPEVNRG
jgi:hypothetical protein